MPFPATILPILADAAPAAPLPPDAGKYWVDNLDPFVVHFPPGWFLPGIRWYGLAYIAGFLIATWLLHRRGPLHADDLHDPRRPHRRPPGLLPPVSRR
jgi:hypothetical protein